MSLRRSFLLCLVAALLGPHTVARALPPDLGAICGNLYSAQTRSVAGAARSYRWVLNRIEGSRVYAELWTIDQNGTARRYPGFTCQLNGNQPMTALPYVAPGNGGDRGNDQGDGGDH